MQRARRIPHHHVLNIVRRSSPSVYRHLSGDVIEDALLTHIVLGDDVQKIIQAFAALLEQNSRWNEQVIRFALRHDSLKVRECALELLFEHPQSAFHDEIRTILDRDPVWKNRRLAVRLLRNEPSVLAAADDPHWRVRHALIQQLLDDPDVVANLREMPPKSPIRDRRRLAVAAYLESRSTGFDPPSFEPFDRCTRCPFWDWDPAVLAMKLRRMTKHERASQLNVMAFLAAHEDERVWKIAVDTIREFGTLNDYRLVFAHRDDPRIDIEPAITRLLDGVEEEMREQLPGPLPTLPQLDWSTIAGSPFARAAKLTHERAAQLMQEPTLETSWHVLETAARIMKVPIWELESERAHEPIAHATPPEPPPRERSTVVHPNQVVIGPQRLVVSRMGISGHYGLPTDGFHRAADVGVNWFFWEPNYSTLTTFSRGLAPTSRRAFHFVAGTFEAEAAKIRRDVEQALRLLRIERLGLFLVFWVQSPDRLTPDLRRTLEELQREGKVLSFGLSSHHRGLLVDTMRDGWNPIMARHNAGHRGAETHLFPHLTPTTSVITFNNLCYGRMLKPIAGLTPPTAADCYRYTLSFPQVAACWSAPATLEQLDENLRVLDDPHLPTDRLAALQAFGAVLYAEEKRFERLVRML